VTRRCAVVTGASSGVGKSAARMLAEQGWHVIAHGRDGTRSEAALAELRAVASPEARVDMVRCDLSLLAETARMADEIAGLTDRVHVLINNAGGVRDHMEITPEGNEITFAGNHLGHFLLTKRLMPLLEAAAAESEPGAVRILATSSEGHKVAPPFDWDDLQRVNHWVTGTNYCLAKLCNMLFTRELARCGAPLGIVANAMHPGEAKTNFAAHAEPWMARMIEEQNEVSPDVGGDTLAWLASAPEMGLVTGGYFYERHQLDLVPAAANDADAARLWAESEKLLARSGF
jgi:NAD(P)-dependent dehydrogenase (short-subunit alcohol dehydrogenase family)